MFRQSSTSFIKRQLKTSEPRFKRLLRDNSSQKQLNTTQHHNFPSVKKGNGFDNSKENLLYETHLLKVRSACKLDETTIVSKYLNTIRKDYDEMSKVGRRELSSMQLKKREIDFMRQKNRVFAEKREEVEKAIRQKEKATLEITGKYEDSRMETKILEQIISRMKKDEIFYKQFGRLRDEELRRKAKEHKMMEETCIHEEEKLHKLQQTLGEYTALYLKNRELREKKFMDFSGKISDVKERDKFIQERKERTYQLQSIELNDTLDEKNIHMREIILAHKVADSLLECKVSTLIKQYSDIQGAFHIVKVKTGIHEPHLLTSKFFSYEQTAEQLLESISENQKRLLELTQRKAKLTETFKQIKNENLMNDIKESSKAEPNHTSHKKQILIKEINDKKLLMDQIVNWMDKRLQDFIIEKPPKPASFQQRFAQLCLLVRQSVKKYKDYDLNEKKPQTTGIRLKKFVKQMSAEQISLRIRETQEMNESNIIQDQFIQTSRQNILRKGFSIKQFKRQSGTLISK